LASASKIFRSKIGSARVRKEMVCSMSARLSEMVSGSACSIFLMALKQRFLEAGAAILLQALFGDDEREEFALGDLHRRETR
jgi:hypothetical protein